MSPQELVFTAHGAGRPGETAVLTDEPDERVEALHQNLRDTGTLCNTLIRACEIIGDVKAVRPGTAEH